jgi:hypothetical protein
VSGVIQTLFRFAKRFFKKKRTSLFEFDFIPISRSNAVKQLCEGTGFMASAEEPSRFGVDTRSGKLVIGKLRIPMPRSRAGRIGLGSALMVGGTLGFLPILGFWMVPLGFLILSNDIPFVRRQRRKLAIWWERRRRARNER